jgi:hypothetical protein
MSRSPSRAETPPSARKPATPGSSSVTTWSTVSIRLPIANALNGSPATESSGASAKPSGVSRAPN